MDGNICFEAQDNLKRYESLKGKQRREAESLLEVDRKVREQLSLGTTGGGHRNVIKIFMLIPPWGMVGPGFRDIILCTLTAFLQSCRRMTGLSSSSSGTRWREIRAQGREPQGVWGGGWSLGTGGRALALISQGRAWHTRLCTHLDIAR